jgi:hypothetical protein
LLQCRESRPDLKRKSLVRQLAGLWLMSDNTSLNERKAMDVLIQVPIFDWFFLLALFPISFFWVRGSSRISIKRDFSEVALYKGMPPPNAVHDAPYESRALKGEPFKSKD